MIALSWREVAYAIGLVAALHITSQLTAGPAAVSTGEIELLQGDR